MKKTIVEVTSILYIILFLYTGISKLIDYSIFREQIAESPILMPIAKPIAVILPWVEFFVVFLLTIPRWRLKGLYMSLGLMTIFIIYIVAILMSNKHLPCSCGGILQELSWTGHLVFNTVSFFLAILAIKIERDLRKSNYKDMLNKLNNNDYRYA